MSTDPGAIVTTTTGGLVGSFNKEKNQHTFFGIPYAEAPVGPLRFKPTIAKRRWEGIFDATHFGASGPQVFDPTEGEYSEFTDEALDAPQPWVGKEDNLTLNIWTPAPDDKKRPVIVWIHGGANWLESSRLAAYHGDTFVARGDVVFVSINYRLGIFGFLDISVLGGDAYEGSHSHGLQDQVVALRWIKENIRQFGGDAGNITVMGESAGSIDISWLLTNGLLDGIAARVALMSGVAGLMGLSGSVSAGMSEEYGQERARDLFARMRITSIGELVALSTKEIMERLIEVVHSTDMLTYMDSQFWPRVSPNFAPEDPLRGALKKGAHPAIDVMIGHTGYEMGLWINWDDSLDTHPTQWAADKIIDFTPELAQDAARAYDTIYKNEPSGVPGMHLLGDSVFVMPSVWLADRLSENGSRVWMYQFDRETNPRLRALHAADQIYFFDKHDTATAAGLVGIPKDEEEKKSRVELTHAMQDAVLAFAKGGDPNADTPNMPHWPQYTVPERAVMSFNTECGILRDPAKIRREWWYQRVYQRMLN